MLMRWNDEEGCSSCAVENDGGDCPPCVASAVKRAAGSAEALLSVELNRTCEKGRCKSSTSKKARRNNRTHEPGRSSGCRIVVVFRTQRRGAGRAAGRPKSVGTLRARRKASGGRLASVCMTMHAVLEWTHWNGEANQMRRSKRCRCSTFGWREQPIRCEGM
jgi:hypothetical protein